MKSKGFLTRYLALCLALTLPGAALAENQVVALPTAVPQVSVKIQTDEYAIDMEAYYQPEQQNGQPDNYDYPALASDEKARVPDLISRYNGGERPAQSVLDKVTDVSVAVYGLPPQDYNGETFYVLLPARVLTDEELLELIDAFAQLGLTFEPEQLSWRNCKRAGIECTRAPAAEERVRMSSLSDLYKRQGLRPERAFTPTPSDDGVGMISLREDDYFGLDHYVFRPARRLTDEELLEMIDADYAGNAPDGAAYSDYENATRALLRSVLGMPLSAQRTGEFLSTESNYSTDGLLVYGAYFSALLPDGGTVEYSAALDTTTGQLLYAATLARDSWLYSDLHLDPFDESWVELGRKYIADMRTDGTEITSIASQGEVELQYGGWGVYLTAVMADGSGYVLRIRYQDETLYDVDYEPVATTLEDTEAAWMTSGNI